jgi:hypothetical protein
MTVPAPKQGGDGYASLLAELKERIRKARLKGCRRRQRRADPPLLEYRSRYCGQANGGRLGVRASLIALLPIYDATFRR